MNAVTLARLSELHSQERDLIPNELTILSPSANCLNDQKCGLSFGQKVFADTNLENRTFRVTGTLTHERSEHAAARRWQKPERSPQRMNLPGEAGTR